MKKQEREPKPHEIRDPELPPVQGAEQTDRAGGRVIS